MISAERYLCFNFCLLQSNPTVSNTKNHGDAKGVEFLSFLT